MPLFSIVIPSYNREQSITRTLDSVLNQTFSDWECIVIDDHSTDNTRNIVSNYCKNDSRYILISNESKKGANGARNTGIMHARGKYISFLDSDDSWSTTMLQKQISLYRSDEKIGCIYSDIKIINNDGVEHPFGIPLGVEGYCYSKVLEQGYLVATSALSAKRECLLDVGMFDLDLPASQDDDICFKLAKQHKIGYLSDVLTYMYIDADNRISDNSGKVAMGWWMLWNKYEHDVLQYCDTETMKKHYKECLHNFVHANNTKMSWKAYKKYSQFGGFISIRQKIWLMAYCLSNGYSEYINQKIKSKL